MSTTQGNGEYGIRVAGGKVAIIDAVEDVTIKALDPADALDLLECLDSQREAITAMAERKAWAEKIARVAGTVIRYADVPHSLTVDRDGVTVKFHDIAHVEAIAEALGEPVTADYDAKWATYGSLANRVSFTVVSGGVAYSATDVDVDIAAALTAEPVSA